MYHAGRVAISRTLERFPITRAGRCGATLLVSTLVVLACGPAEAPPPVGHEISETCLDCEPGIRRYALLGGRGAGVGRLGQLERGDNGRYYVTHNDAPAEIGVHDRSGRYFGALGRHGDGPGEFRNIMSIAVEGDSVHVFDSRTARHTVLHVSGSVGRTRPLVPDILRAWRAPSGSIVVHRTCTSAAFECDSDPFYLFDDTAHIASFGRHDDDNARSIGRAWRAGAVEADGFWAARDGQYRLYKWDYNGVLVDSIVRRVPWFPDHNITPFRQGVRPGPIIRDIRIDNRRRLWVVTLVAAPEWADQFRDAPAPDMRFNWNMEGYFDSVLEVIDLNTRRVIAHARFPEYVSRITNTFQLVAEKEDAIGEPFLDVWDISLPRR